MKTIIRIIYSITAIMLLTSSCKDKNKTTPCVAGSGGAVTIVAFAKHNGVQMNNYVTHNDTAWVKFGQTTSPGAGTSHYDTYFIGEGGEDHIHCTGLHCGDYYVYRSAWDSVANVTYYGGYGLSFSDETTEQDIVIPVN